MKMLRDFLSGARFIARALFPRRDLEREIARRKPIEAALNAEIARRGEIEAALHLEIVLRKRLEAEAERFFNLSPDNLVVANFNGFFKRLNPAWETCLGWTREELMSRPLLDFVHPDDLPDTEALFRENTAGRDTTAFENRYRCRDGSYKWLEWRATVVLEEQLIYAAARDVTKAKRADLALQVTLLQLERSNRELQDFASIASHDLQEPLRAIQAFGERLQTRHGAQLDDEARDYLARMKKAAERMRALIGDLLAYSRVTTKARPFAPVDLHSLAQGILADLVIRLEETGGRIEVGALPTIEADAMQMRQLFQNLLDNALKFHRADQAPIVKISAAPLRDAAKRDTKGEAALVCIVVEDNGIGLNEKFIERIFAPFERLHASSKYPGTGIGLAICRKIVERHGGNISVKSVPDRGSQFRITLPLRATQITLEELGIRVSPGIENPS